MAAHHHPYHHHCHPTTTASACYCYCFSTCCVPPPPDALLHSLPPHIHHSSSQPHLYSSYPNPQTFHHQPPSTHLGKPAGFENRHFEHQQSENQPLVSSLLRRIDALESSLRRKCAANPTFSSSLRDAAARTIQTHFRAFLVHRSRTLRQLKDLASVKSALNSLKGLLSQSAGIDPRALCVKATDLLLQLDSIQDGDPMIRDGKRLTGREIIRFLGFLDGLAPKRNDLSRIELKNVRSGDKTRVLYGGKKVGTANLGAREERILLEKLRGRVENLQGFNRVSKDEDYEEGFQLANSRTTSGAKIDSMCYRNGGLLKMLVGSRERVKKTVSFAKDGNVSRVIVSTDEPISGKSTSSSDESDSIDEEKELRGVEDGGVISKGSEDGEEETQSEDGNLSYANVREGNFGKSFRAEEDYYEINGHGHGENKGFVFSAPLPVKMESRVELMKRKALGITD